jgi:hypothetical protein
MSSPHCLHSNSDISGIGVRIAIYAQAILTLAQPLVAGSDGWIDTNELKDLFSIYLNILLPASALIFAAIIQARTFGLSAYHVIVVLYLGWINNTTALVFFAFVLIALPGWIARQNAEAQSQKVSRYHQEKLEAMWPNDEPFAIMKVDRLEDMRQAVRSAWALKDELERKKEDEEFENSILQKEIEWVKEWIQTKIRTIQIWEVQEHELDSIRKVFRGSDCKRKEWEGTSKPETEIGEKRHEEMSTRVNFWDIESKREVQVTAHKFEWSRPCAGVIVANLSQKPVLMMAALVSFHFTFFASFGLWFWLTVRKFGTDHDCVPFIYINSFGINIPITSSAFRILSILVYIFGSLPVINIATTVVLWFAFIFFLQLASSWMKPKKYSRDSSLVTYLSGIYFGNYSPHDARRFFRWAVLATFLGQLWFIVCTELTIRNNQHMLVFGARENDWTLGQTLSMVLLVLPLISVFTSLWKSVHKLRRKESGRNKPRS